MRKIYALFQESCFRVENPIRNDKIRYPRVRITADADICIAVRLAKAGYYGGDPEQVLNARTDLVLHAYNYENFARDLDATFTELNTQTKV